MVGRSVASMTSGGAPGANDGGDEVRGGTGMPQGKVPEVPHHLPAPRHSSGAGRQGQVPRDGMVNVNWGYGRPDGADPGRGGAEKDALFMVRDGCLSVFVGFGPLRALHKLVVIAGRIRAARGPLDGVNRRLALVLRRLIDSDLSSR